MKKLVANFWTLVCVWFIAGCCLNNLPAQTNDQRGFLGVQDEDDSYSFPWIPHQDRHYTHGIKISYIGGNDPDPGLLIRPLALFTKIPAIGFKPEGTNYGWALGQNMYTPQNLLDPNPIPTDRPYAGWLYTGPLCERREDIAPNLAAFDSYELDAGMIGPDSLAGSIQTALHRQWFPNDIPQGWHNQLKNEPGVVLKYGEIWRYSPTPAMARYIDIIPQAGADVGTIFDFAEVGATARLGLNLPRDFGEQLIDYPIPLNSDFANDSHCAFVYLFGSVNGRAILHDTTLDGSLFQSDPSVNKYYFVGDLNYGVSVQFPFIPIPSCCHRFRVELAYTHVTRSLEFHGQKGDDYFGSITIKLNVSM